MHLQFTKVDLHLLFMNRVTYHKVSNFNELHYFHPNKLITCFVTNGKELCDEKISEGDILLVSQH